MTKNMKILTAILVVAVILFVLKRKGMLGTASTTKAATPPVTPPLIPGEAQESPEVMSGAAGACGHPNAPSSYQAGSYGCNFLMNCGAGGEATPNGTGGYTLSCNGQTMGETGSNGSGTARPVRKSRNLVEFFGGTRRV